MAARAVLFGATGYTGRLVAEAMVERGMRPVLAARDRGKLESLAEELGGGLETATADVSEPRTVGQLVERDDVLVTTVGPFLRYGAPAAGTAATHGAHYLDSTGEPPFVREVFERYGHAAAKSGCGMLTAFGWDFVPGNLAGALALERAGERATHVDVGYFARGPASPSAASGGTLASLSGVVIEQSHAYRDGRVQPERAARHSRTFEVRGKQLPGITVGGSEHYALPRLQPGLRSVDVYLGWFGPASRAAQVLSGPTAAAMKVPGAKRLWNAAASKFVKGSTGGPDEEARAKTSSHIVAIACDEAGEQLSEVHLTGVNGYTFTGRILAWGAERAAAGGLQDTGALGPADGFGLRALEEGCRESGLEAEDGSREREATAAPDREKAETRA